MNTTPVYNNIACFKAEHIHACRHLEHLVELLMDIQYQVQHAEEGERIARYNCEEEVLRVRASGQWESEEQAEEYE
jgi:hypothetical protein